MRLCGLLLTLSLVLADENGNDIYGSCEEALHSYDTTTVIEKKNDENCTNSSLSEIPCFIYNVNLLSCSWRTDSLPEDAHYSASFHTTKDHPLNCTSESSKKLVECQGRFEKIKDEEDFTVIVNISINDYWCIICQNYASAEIEKLDPPQNITTSIKSTNLEIQWLQPRSCCNIKNICFIYEVKINNKSVELEGELAYNKTNFDPTRSYTIQIRSKLTFHCVTNEHWSDWSKAVVVESSGDTYKHNIVVIVSIALVLPMILLAFLLVCKFQRLFEKLFPSIPNPSKNVQMLLEKNDFNQVMPHKQSEEGTEILEVIG